MALVYFRGYTFIGDYVVKYFRSLFTAWERGQLDFFDGTKELSISATPDVIKRASWDFRRLPAILIGEASGSYKTVSITKDFIDEPTPTATIQKRSIGGDIELTLNLFVRATTKEECSALADIVGIFLSNPTAKDYFMKQYLKLPEPARIGPIRDVPEPAIDHPIYEMPLTILIVGTWREEEDLADRLTDIITTISAELDL